MSKQDDDRLCLVTFEADDHDVSWSFLAYGDKTVRTWPLDQVDDRVLAVKPVRVETHDQVVQLKSQINPGDEPVRALVTVAFAKAHLDDGTCRFAAADEPHYVSGVEMP